MKNSMENEEKNSNLATHKRLLGTLDPDYAAPPDSKKIKLLKEKGEEELYGRTIKVIERHVLQEINDLTLDLEDIDDRILKVQQFLHTLRFQASLNLYAYDKVKDRNAVSSKNSKISHPTVRRLLGEELESPADIPTSECVSRKPIQDVKVESQSELQKVPPKTDLNDRKLVKIAPKPTLIQDENFHVISHGRKEKFQKKMKIILGNTYQYLKDSENVDDYMRFKWRMYVRSYSDDVPLTNFISSVTFTLDESYAPHHIIRVREPPFSICRKGWGEFKVYVEFEFVDPRNKSIQLLHPLTLARTGDPLSVTGLWRLGKEVMYDIWIYDGVNESIEFCQSEKSDHNLSRDSLITRLEEQGVKSETVYSDTEGNVTLAHTKVEAEATNPECEESLNISKEDSNVTSKSVSEEKLPIFLQQNVSNGEESSDTKQSNGIDQASEYFQNDLETITSNKIPQSVSNVKCVPKSNIPSTIKIVTSSNNNSKIIQTSVNPSAKNTQFKLNLMNSGSSSPNKILTPVSNCDTASSKNLSKILVRQADGSLISVMVPEKMYHMALKMSAERNSNKLSNIQPRLATSKSLELNQNVSGKSLLSKIPLSQKLPSSPTFALPKSNTVYSSSNSNQQSLKIKGGTIPLSKVPLIQTSKGTLLRLNPVQSPITTSATKFVQPLSPQLGSLRTRPTHVVIPQNKIKVRVSSHNAAVGNASTPIRLTFGNSRIGNQNVLNLRDSLASKQPLTNLGKIQNQLNMQTTSTVVRNTVQLGNNKIIYSIPSMTDSSNSNLTSTNLSNSTLTSPSNGESPSIGKISTRRIYISAPPHLVKLREVEANKNKIGNETQTASKQKLQSKPKKCNKVSGDEISLVELFEKRKSWLRSRSESCRSVEEVLAIFLKGIPLASKEETDEHVFPFVAQSEKHFKSFLLGRKRALEFWRAREILRELKKMKTPNWEEWSTYSIVMWARRHLYTPMDKMINGGLELEQKRLRNERKIRTSTLTIKDVDEPLHSGEVEEDFLVNLNVDKNDSLVVVDDDDESEEKQSPRSTKRTDNSNESEEKEKSMYIVNPLSADEIHFIDRTLSTVMVRIEPEEIVPGVKMEAAKHVLWRATLSLMEDLLRLSFAEASSLTQIKGTKNFEDNPPISIESKHVLSVLANRRPQFKLLNRFALAKRPLKF